MVVPFSGLIVTDAPSLPSAPFGPVRPIEPSFPLIATAAPSLPATPIEPSLPSLPSLPNVILSFKAKVTFAPVSPLTCSTVKFLPALNSTVLVSAIFFAVASWLAVTAPPSADDFTFQDDFALLKSTFDKSTLKS